MFLFTLSKISTFVPTKIDSTITTKRKLYSAKMLTGHGIYPTGDSHEQRRHSWFSKSRVAPAAPEIRLGLGTGSTFCRGYSGITFNIGPDSARLIVSKSKCLKDLNDSLMETSPQLSVVEITNNPTNIVIYAREVTLGSQNHPDSTLYMVFSINSNILSKSPSGEAWRCPIPTGARTFTLAYNLDNYNEISITLFINHPRIDQSTYHLSTHEMSILIPYQLDVYHAQGSAII